MLTPRCQVSLLSCHLLFLSSPSPRLEASVGEQSDCFLASCYQPALALPEPSTAWSGPIKANPSPTPTRRRHLMSMVDSMPDCCMAHGLWPWPGQIMATWRKTENARGPNARGSGRPGTARASYIAMSHGIKIDMDIPQAETGKLQNGFGAHP